MLPPQHLRIPGGRRCKTSGSSPLHSDAESLALESFMAGEPVHKMEGTGKKMSNMQLLVAMMQVWGCGFLAKSHYINLQDERQIGEDCPPSNISRTLCVLLSSGRGKNLHWKSFWTSCLWCWHPIATSSLVTTARTPLAWRDATAASLQAHSHPATSAGNWSPAVVPRQGRPSLARPRLDLTSVHQFLWPGQTIPTASRRQWCRAACEGRYNIGVVFLGFPPGASISFPNPWQVCSYLFESLFMIEWLVTFALCLSRPSNSATLRRSARIKLPHGAAQSCGMWNHGLRARWLFQEKWRWKGGGQHPATTISRNMNIPTCPAGGWSPRSHDVQQCLFRLLSLSRQLPCHSPGQWPSSSYGAMGQSGIGSSDPYKYHPQSCTFPGFEQQVEKRPLLKRPAEPAGTSAQISQMTQPEPRLSRIHHGRWDWPGALPHYCNILQWHVMTMMQIDANWCKLMQIDANWCNGNDYPMALPKLHPFCPFLSSVGSAHFRMLRSSCHWLGCSLAVSSGETVSGKRQNRTALSQSCWGSVKLS